MAMPIRKIVSQFFKGSNAQHLSLPRRSFAQQSSLAADIREETKHEKKSTPSVLEHPDYFNISEMVNLKALFNARVHMGHKRGTLNPWMVPYVYGARFDHLIIDLDQTVDHLKKALNFTAHIAYRDGIILFTGRHPQMSHRIEAVAEECGEFAHVRSWFNGTFTDSVKRFGTVTRLPDLVILLSLRDTVHDHHPALNEASKMLIPTVAVVDTDVDPRLVTYPVPGNDDSLQSIELYLDLFKGAILRGKQRRKFDGVDENAE